MSKKIISIVGNTTVGILIFHIVGFAYSLMEVLNHPEIREYYGGSVLNATFEVLWNGFIGILLMLIFGTLGTFCLIILPIFYLVGLGFMNLLKFLFKKKSNQTV